MTISRYRIGARLSASALIVTLSVLGAGEAGAHELGRPAPIPAPLPAPVFPTPAPMPDPWPEIVNHFGPQPPLAEPAPQAEVYTDDLDGWIRQSLVIMDREGIPGSYEGIRRNIMRESGGNPRAVNNYDRNAAAGTPSKGLLQVIEPTFRAHRVEGTSEDIFDPVANITAACRYAADKYGSIDNVDGPY
ncbi:transglycosylase SLT domain-containing protein [Nocardia brasiliensis]|uniref:transglycosylase SLT domain-containing protein n=1 Tax=Nocardia brasiliensis TaxID=37326 RepID=UPI002458D4B7|nr:transglycosylase SLT domain-containing protein [Nocardia brasiliensis]